MDIEKERDFIFSKRGSFTREIINQEINMDTDDIFLSALLINTKGFFKIIKEKA
jgi:hypothetical protein